jgi:hypothetical protein
MLVWMDGGRMKIDFAAVFDMINIIQQSEYPDEKEWFFDVQTVDQLMELLEDLMEGEE